jgi:hypothetical protein
MNFRSNVKKFRERFDEGGHAEDAVWRWCGSGFSLTLTPSVRHLCCVSHAAAKFSEKMPSRVRIS